MKQDVRLTRNENGLYDLSILDGDFEAVDGFETAILVSIFTDDRAQPFQVSSADRRRGWIGNIETAAIGRSLGSLLWLYQQSRLTQDILNQMSIEAQSSLNWMVEDGEAKSVSAVVTRSGQRDILITIDIVTTDGRDQQYTVLWRNTGNVS